METLDKLIGINLLVAGAIFVAYFARMLVTPF
jgi:hypothetical protein